MVFLVQQKVANTTTSIKNVEKVVKESQVYKLRTSCSGTGSPRSDMELLNASGMELTQVTQARIM